MVNGFFFFTSKFANRLYQSIELINLTNIRKLITLIMGNLVNINAYQHQGFML